ncbi:MAG TPA: glycosyltransferase family 4 protein [Sphingomicrobium sp.]|jgi:glycosyltransferase involved in cell wall biosynthesis|nr:glycosyltransferase family 4 protein [Sphingomicrobium sp.]
MRAVHANFVRPPDHADPDRLLEEWPTLLDVAEATANAGVESTLLQSFGRDAAIERRGVRCQFVEEPALPGSWSGMTPWRIAQAAVRTGADVIHVNGLDFPTHTRAMCKSGIPVLAQDHASRPGGRRRLRRWGLAGIAGAAFTDIEQAKAFREEGSLSSEVPIFAVPESSSRFRTGDQAEAQAATGISGSPALLWVGRLDENKDPLTMLDAFELAVSDLSDAHLWCCYHEQPLLDAVKARIAQSPALISRVHLLGRVPHERVELLCRAADIFVAASHREGSGYALIEALACGTTPVLSDIPSFRRLGGDVAALAPVGDARSLATAIISTARKPKAELRQRTVEHFASNLSFRAVGARLREIYRALAPAAA